ncbi:DUF4340 domain-containing protein [uncultured Psychrosphaera sp.]|uniref:DUF4340 domain-containing protein n=1 Tax=uncultured Psychrosphaera sp. TaxID=1403522 RepID=UPI0026020360|nr:DUF4340 domain-containing protein [uncultured Psychrosphaera sp.]
MRISFLIKVLVVGVLAILLSSYFISQNKGVQNFDDTLLLTEFDVNLVDKIQIQNAASKQFISAEKISGKWVLPNKFGYAADIKKLSKLLQNLKDTQIVELKTKQAKYYSRLGLQSLDQGNELDAEKSQAQLLTLVAGDDFTQLLIGNESQSSTGRYVRFARQEQAYLVALDINLPKDDTDWLMPNILPINVDQVRQVDITLFNKESNTTSNSKFTIERKELEQDETVSLAEHFELLNKAEDQIPQYGSIFTGLVRNIINITAKDIKLAEPNEMELYQTIVLKYLDTPENLDNKVMLDNKAQSKTLTLQLYENDKEPLNYWVRLEQSKYLINISEFDFKQISKPLSDYLE